MAAVRPPAVHPSAVHPPAAHWRSLGADAALAVTDPALSQDAADLAAALLDWVDRACSRFRPDSDLVLANDRAGHWTRVDPLLTDVVAAAVRAARNTAGRVDPTLGLVLSGLGYDRDLADVRAGVRYGGIDRGGAPACPARPGAWREIGLDPDGGLLVPVGTALDLGAIGRAFAVDLVATELAEVLGCGVLAALGPDVAVAGSSPEGSDGPGWAICVDQAALPQQPGAPTAVPLLAAGGLATSSTRSRTWQHAGRQVHHLLDPVSGEPVPIRWTEISVRAASCVAANTASTAGMVLGDAAPDWLRRQGMAARLRAADGTVVATPEWPLVPDARVPGALPPGALPSDALPSDGGQRRVPSQRSPGRSDRPAPPAPRDRA